MKRTSQQRDAKKELVDEKSGSGLDGVVDLTETSKVHTTGLSAFQMIQQLIAVLEPSQSQSILC